MPAAAPAWAAQHTQDGPPCRQLLLLAHMPFLGSAVLESVRFSKPTPRPLPLTCIPHVLQVCQPSWRRCLSWGVPCAASVSGQWSA